MVKRIEKMRHILLRIVEVRRNTRQRCALRSARQSRQRLGKGATQRGLCILHDAGMVLGSLESPSHMERTPRAIRLNRGARVGRCCADAPANCGDDVEDGAILAPLSIFSLSV